MDKSFDKLRQTVLQAVDAQRTLPKNAARGSQYVFAQYIRVQLTKLGMNEAAFAQSLRLPLDQTHALLEGLLPDPALTDDLIVRVARTLKCDVNLLRIMLNRSYTPADAGTSVEDVSDPV